MSKVFTIGLILCLVLLNVGYTAAAQSQQKNNAERMRAQNELALYKAEIVDATPVQLGKLTGQQRIHSKLYSQYQQLNKKKISEVIASGEGKVMGIHFGVGLGEVLTEPESPEKYFGELAHKSNAVIRGRVIKKVSQVTEDDSFIFTDYDVVVMEVLKNNATSTIDVGAIITVTRPGGKILVDGVIMEVIDNCYTPFSVGNHDVVLFLKFIGETGAYKATQDTGSFELFDSTLRPLTGVHFPPGVIQDSTSFLRTIRMVSNR